MTIHTMQRSTLALLIALIGISALPSSGSAATSDYQFTIANQPVKAGHDVPFALLVKQVSSGKTATNVSISEPKLHMAMGSMDMPAKVKLLPDDDKGSIRLSGDLTMYGEWTLDLTASLPDEQEPFHTSVKFQVVK